MRVRTRLGKPPARVESLMKPGVPTIEPGRSLRDAAARMLTERVGALTVMEEGRLVGILTERDLLRATAEGRSTATRVSSCMTAEPGTIDAAEAGADAAQRMIDLGVRHLPVTREERVVGVVSARDLLHLGRRPPPELLGYEPW